MSALKLHAVFKGTEKGTVNADFRDVSLGHAEGDEHRTLAEIDPADDATVAEAIVAFPLLNAHLEKLGMEVEVPDILGGGKAFLRFGIFNN